MNEAANSKTSYQAMVVCDFEKTPHTFGYCNDTRFHVNPRLVEPAPSSPTNEKGAQLSTLRASAEKLEKAMRGIRASLSPSQKGYISVIDEALAEYQKLKSTDV